MEVARGDTIVAAQIDPTGRCIPKTSSVCNNIAGLTFGSMIYVNDSVPESAIVAAVSPYYQQAQLLSTFGEEKCLAQLEVYLCLSAFLACENATGNTTVLVLPVQPCRNVCEVTTAECAVAFKTFGQTLPPCPINDTTIDLTSVGGPSFTAACTYSSVAENKAECIPAHEALLGVHQARVLRVCYIVFGWLGFLGNIGVLVLYLLTTKFTIWPTPLVVVMSASQALLAFGLVLGGFVDRRAIICNTSANVIRLCKVQGVFIVAGLNFSLAMWFIMTVTTFVIVMQRDPRKMQRYFSEKWYFPMIYLIVPLLFTCLSLPHVGANSAFLVCVETNIEPVERFVIWPICGEMVIGTVCWIGTLIVLIKTFAAEDWRRSATLYLRMLVYAVLALFPACMLTIPIELLRNRVYSGDLSLLTDGSGERAAQGLTIGCFMTPVMFAIVFAFRHEHVAYVREKIKSITTSTMSKSFSDPTPEEVSKF